MKTQTIFWSFLAISSLLIFASFFPNLKGLLEAWNTEEYSHGYIIPFLSVLIGWHILTEKKPETRPSWLGFPLVIIGFLFLIISQLSAFATPSYYGFVIALIGITISFFGLRFAIVLIPAFIYLIFAIPLPKLIYMGLSAELQLISSSLGVFILQMLGISVFQDGNIIDLGTQKLQVVEACSGLRYLFPLMSFSFLIAFLLDDKMWKRIFIFLSAIPITIAMNSLRIAIVGILVNWGGSEMAEGLIHDLEGWMIFLICITILMIEVWILTHIGYNKGRLRHEYIGFASGSIITGKPKLKTPSIIIFVITIMLSSFTIIYDVNDRKEITPSHPKFAFFPLNLGEWHGRQSQLEPNILETLKLTDYFIADYKKSQDQEPVNLYMAYYNSQRVGTSAHSPSNCLPGGGWKITKREIIPVELENKSIPVTRMVITKGDQSLLMYYWFDQRGRIINDQYGAKWYLLVDSITKQRTDGALVRLTTPILDYESKELADKRIQDLIKESYSKIRQYIPQ